jgi:hypothetical protein
MHENAYLDSGCERADDCKMLAEMVVDRAVGAII